MSSYDGCLGMVYSLVFSVFTVTFLPWFAHVDTMYTINHCENQTQLYTIYNEHSFN